MLTEAQRQQLHKELKARGWVQVIAGNDCMKWEPLHGTIEYWDNVDEKFTETVLDILGIKRFF